MQTTAVFGQRIAYYDVGSGPVLVLLHGLGSNAAFDWGRVIPELAKTHRVLAMDQIGFGASAKPEIDFTLQTWVDFLGEFLRTQHVDKFTLAGESLGGAIATLYTVEALDATNGRAGALALPRPGRLLLCDAAGHMHGALPPDFLAHLVPGTLESQRTSLARIFYDKSLASPEAARKAYEAKLAAQDGFTVRSIMANFHDPHDAVEQRLGNITVPTLVVWGRDDELIPLTDGEDFAEKIHGAHLAVIPECGHAPMVEKPVEFLAAVEPFLSAAR